ncbi:MAG: triose-phosphate isomerase [Patescibacteria group bacterium]|nr:triose-phosphate isomerase [Patescibacteria group bacterium]
MKKKPLVVANWKMNPATFREAKKLFDATKRAAEKVRGISVVVAPPAIFLRGLSGAYKGKRVAFAAQDVSADEGGAHTGELSAAQIKDARAKYIIVGHSERRASGESDADVRRKTRAVLDAKLTPIICVGERERGASGEHFDVVRRQLQAAFADVASGEATRVVVAYEPIWAIGKEETMPPRAMHEMAIFIRKTLVATHGESAMSLSVIYGGAATEENAGAMLSYGDVTGLLVGHVSIDAQRFAALLREAGNI